MKLTDYKQTKESDKTLIIGLPGTGKSTLAANLSLTHHLIWIDIENGVKTLTKLPQTAQDNIDLIMIPDSAAVPMAADTIVKLFKTGKANICNEHGKIDCALCKVNKPTEFSFIDFSTLTKNDIVVLDTVTQLGFSILSHVTRKIDLETKLDWEQWGTIRRLTEFIASQIQAFDFNFVCIAHLADSKLEDGKVMLVPQFGSSVMSGTFAKVFDHVVYTEVVNGKHKAGSSTGYKNNILTKSRTDFRIEDLPVPSLLPIYDGSHTKKPAVPASNAIAMNLLKGIKKS